MTQDEIADTYQEANGWSPRAYPNTMAELEAFAKLVAEKERAEFAVHAVDIARRAIAKERERFCEALRQLHDSYSLASDPSSIRARGQE